MILVFDLDDTLYDESTFVYSGFKAVARHLEEKLSLDFNQTLMKLNDILDTQGRGTIFDTFLRDLGLFNLELLSNCVSVYQSHTPTIEPYLESVAMLELYQDMPKYLVTDGNPGVQAKKVEALGIAKYFKGIYYTWSYGVDFSKPSVSCFEMICNLEKVSFSDIMYVGDDPSKDFVNLRTHGAITVRVMTGRFSKVSCKDEFDAEFNIAHIGDLKPYNLFELHRKVGRN
jgi:putative hydrolase of the HAD superfamily